jgi:radical SAM superfamily enzyme YgiQ (UPF0313 family)
MGIQGEGETAFVMLLDGLERQADVSAIPGLCLPAAGGRQKSRFAKDLDDHPQPLPNVHLHLPCNTKDEEIWIPVQTRRGCPMDCSYCSTASIEGRIMRRHSVAWVLEFLRRYADAGFKKFFFVDNTFNFPLIYAKDLCEQIIAAGLNIQWRCILYPWKVDEALVAKMAEAGCREVALGFESGTEQILKRLNKRFGPDDVRIISAMLAKHKIHRMGFLLLGGPGETRQSVEESLYFADSLETEAMKISTGIRIYPHTLLHQIAVDQGLIALDDDLLFPRFYIAAGLQGWLEEVVGRWLERCSNWMK